MRSKCCDGRSRHLVCLDDAKEGRAFHRHREPCRVARGDDDARRVVITEVKNLSMESTAFKVKAMEIIQMERHQNIIGFE